MLLGNFMRRATRTIGSQPHLCVTIAVVLLRPPLALLLRLRAHFDTAPKV